MSDVLSKLEADGILTVVGTSDETPGTCCHCGYSMDTDPHPDCARHGFGETHWSISCVQDSVGTAVKCGCGWSMVFSPTPVGTRAQGAQIGQARLAWDKHKCGARGAP